MKLKSIGIFLVVFILFTFYLSATAHEGEANANIIEGANHNFVDIATGEPSPTHLIVNSWLRKHAINSIGFGFYRNIAF